MWNKLTLELALVGLVIQTPEANPATHLAYPYEGAQSGNAVPVCKNHVLLMGLMEKHGGLIGVQDYLKKRYEAQQRVGREMKENARHVLEIADAVDDQETA